MASKLITFNHHLRCQNTLRSNDLCHHFFLPEVDRQVQNSYGVLSRLVSRFKCTELAYGILDGHFGPINLLEASKNDDKDHCFLK